MCAPLIESVRLINLGRHMGLPLPLRPTFGDSGLYAC